MEQRSTQQNPSKTYSAAGPLLGDIDGDQCVGLQQL